MMQRLNITRYSLDRTTALEAWGQNFSGLQIRCNLPGWLEKMWFVVKANSKADAQARRHHHGQRIIVSDNQAVVASGYVYAVERDGLHVRYECAGPWRRHDNEFYTTSIVPDDDIPTLLQAVLSANVPAVWVDADNFDANATEVGDLFAREIERGVGVMPSAVVKALLGMRDAASSLYDYYVLPAPLDACLPQLEVAYYQAREKTRATADWYLRRADLVESDRGEHSHIYDYQSDVTVLYGKVTGTATNASIILVDTTTNFVEVGVNPGDMVTNITQTISSGDWMGAEVAGIGTTTNPNDTLTMRLSQGGSWAISDEYSIKLNEPMYLNTPANNANADLWTSVGEPFEAMELNATQAAQYAAELVSDLSNPIYQEPFTIGAPNIRDINGGRWPVWAMLRKPSYVRIVDQDISDNPLNIDLIGRIGLFTTALDYNHDERVLSVTPTQPSDRLDVRLQQAGILSGQTIESTRGSAHGAFWWHWDNVIVGQFGQPAGIAWSKLTAPWLVDYSQTAGFQRRAGGLPIFLPGDGYGGG